MKNLVFDVNVILDLWLHRVSEEGLLLISGLLADHKDNNYLCWISSTSLPILDYVAQREFKKMGATPEVAGQTTRALLKDLLGSVNLLSNYGFQQLDALKLSNDLEDAQIVLAAAELQGDTAIVTNENRFQTGSGIAEVAPLQAKQWLQDKTNSRSIDFIDLKTQQDIVRPHLERKIFSVLRHGQYIMGPEIKQLEEKLSTYVGGWQL